MRDMEGLEPLQLIEVIKRQGFINDTPLPIALAMAIIREREAYNEATNDSPEEAMILRSWIYLSSRLLEEASTVSQAEFALFIAPRGEKERVTGLMKVEKLQAVVSDD